MLYEYLQTCGNVNIVLIAGEDTIRAALLTLPRERLYAHRVEARDGQRRR